MDKIAVNSIMEYSIKNQEELLNLLLSSVKVEDKDAFRFEFYSNMINYYSQNLMNLYNKEKQRKVELSNSQMNEEEIERIARSIIENPDSVGNFLFSMNESEMEAINNKVSEIRGISR